LTTVIKTVIKYNRLASRKCHVFDSIAAKTWN